MTGAVSTESADPSGDLTPARVPPLSAWWLLIAGVIGLVASMTLTVEKIDILLDPSYVPSCNINPILSCGSVMITPQASLLGFPNPLLGLVAFTVVIVTGLLASTKVTLPQWYWVGLTVGVLAGAVFVHWLIFQSLYRIGALCPYCMVVWAFTPILLAAVTSQIWGNARGALRIVVEWRWTFVIVFYAIVLVMIFLRFQTYWTSLI